MKWFKEIIQSQLFKISSLSSLSVILKIGVGLITSKLLAIFVGPSGMALVGNLRNFMTSVEGVSTLGFQNGIIKYVAEKEDGRLKKIVTTVFTCLFFMAVIISLVLFCFASYWNNRVFGTDFEYSFVFKTLAFSLPWYVVSVFFMSIINGLGKFKKVIWLTIIGNILSVFFSLVLVFNYRTLGALLAIVVTPGLMFFISFYFIQKELSLSENFKLDCFDLDIIKSLSSYSLMALVSSVLGPLVSLVIRKNVISCLGIDQAGFWETMTRISSYYMLFISTILAVYFFPKLAKAKNNFETKTVFWSYYKGIIPLFVIGLFLVYLLRSCIIEFVFTKSFLPVADLFFLQIIGDVLKGLFLILGYQFYAKKMTVAFIISELLSLLVLYLLSVCLIPIFGLQGVLLAQVVDNFVYLSVLVIYFRKSLF